MKKNHRIIAASTAFALVLGLGALTGCQSDQPTQQQAPQQAPQQEQPADPEKLAGDGTSEGPTDADAGVPEGNSVSTEFYTCYFDADMQASVEEDYEPGPLSAGCITNVEKDGKQLYSVGVFSNDWGPQGDFNLTKVGETKDAKGNAVSVWVFAPFDLMSQEEVDACAARVEVK
ncbi:MAG: hypothetical protein Q4D06_01470 [Coriobacteriia bacterium]|nr:hypothetical protein [Coriobacteriia bacterium]